MNTVYPCNSNYMNDNVREHTFGHVCLIRLKSACTSTQWSVLAVCLAFTIPWANPADDKLTIFFLLFPQNRIWQFMQIVTNGNNLHEMSKPFFWENKKNISKYRLLKISHRNLSIKESWHPWLSKMHPIKILIWLHKCASCRLIWIFTGVWGVGAYVRRYFFWCCSSNMHINEENV